MSTLITSQEILQHWLGHKNLTRKVIEKFPEKELFEYSIGGMRPFAQICSELIAISAPAVVEFVTRETKPFTEHLLHFTSKAEILERWDADMKIIETEFPKLKEAQFSEEINLFGQFNFRIIDNLLYIIDNEIHHRGQGYVYLRSLGIEPPSFYDRY